MKKGLLVGALLLGAGAVSAQNLYVGLQAGYGIATPSEVVGTVSEFNSTGQTTTNVYGTYGGGTNIGLNVGYMFGEHVGAELGFNYFLGSTVESTNTTVPTGKVTVNSKSTQFRLAPSLIVTTGGDVALYGKGGLVLPVGGSTVTEYRDSGTNPLVGRVEQDFESKGAMSIGFQGAIGVNYNLSDKLSLFGEVGSVNLRIKGASRTVTAYSVDGTDQLANLDTYDKETVYVEELNPNSNNGAYNSNTNDNQAREELSSSTNYNAMFISVGVKFNL